MIVHLNGRVTIGRWDDLSAFLLSAIPFYEAPGGIVVRLLRDVQDPRAFVETIEYETEEGFARDQQRVDTDPEMLARLDAWHGLLDGPVDLRTLRDVTPRYQNERNLRKGFQ